MPPTARLRSAADFAALRGARGRLAGRCFALRYDHAAGPGARLGLAVSRKVSKRAVERNRIKRSVRESFRHHRAGLPPLDVLVIARSAAAGTPSSGLRAELDGLWRRLRTSSLPPPTAR
ncbi:MAG TPA: ribonuclease P protein component [Rhodanobacteraceae bacterium]|nr:ribonuclease P protein component [Rhodanobacteraceae bacterium]